MPDEKKCPYCAEMVKSEAIICRFCSSNLQLTPTNATLVPNNEKHINQGSIEKNDVSPSPRVAACKTCNVALVKIEKPASVSLAGILGAILFLCGFPLLFFNFVIAILVFILAVVISLGGRQSNIQLVCPQCNRIEKTF